MVTWKSFSFPHTCCDTEVVTSALPISHPQWGHGTTALLATLGSASTGSPSLGSHTVWMSLCLSTQQCRHSRPRPGCHAVPSTAGATHTLVHPVLAGAHHHRASRHPPPCFRLSATACTAPAGCHKDTAFFTPRMPQTQRINADDFTAVPLPSVEEVPLRCPIQRLSTLECCTALCSGS